MPKITQYIAKFSGMIDLRLTRRPARYDLTAEKGRWNIRGGWISSIHTHLLISKPLSIVQTMIV